MAGRKFHISEDDFLEVQKMNEEEGNILPSSEPTSGKIEVVHLANEEKTRTDVCTVRLANDEQHVNFTENEGRSLSEQPEKTTEIYYSQNYDIFIPYHDKKLRLPLLSGKARDDLKASIQLNGIYTPIICKKIPNSNQYEILAGHNRLSIAKELKIEIPFILKDNITKDEEELTVIDTNILQRQIDDIKPSNLAYLLMVKRDAEAHQGISGGSWVDNGTSKEYKLKKTMILAYIKLNELIPGFLDMIDERMIMIKAGYNLAFVSTDNQKLLYEYLQSHHGLIKISESIAKKLKEKDSMNCKFTPEFLDMFFEIISSPKTEPSSAPKKVYGSIVREYFNWASDEDAERIIREALSMANRNTIEMLHKKGE